MNAGRSIAERKGKAAAPAVADTRHLSRFWNELPGTTIKLALLFWTMVIVTDSLLWGVAGVDPIRSLAGKLILNSAGALLAFGMSAIFYWQRGLGLMLKAILAFILSLLAAPVYSALDFLIYGWSVSPEPAVFEWRVFGTTLTSSMAMFFGWSCLYIALIYAFEMRDRERSLAAAREEALAAQMRALRYQVNPHFLFNTLNSIAGLIEENAGNQASKMVMSLSTFLRTTLTLDPLNDVTLRDELALQQEYLDIEQERFSDRMVVSMEVTADAEEALVPSLLLQPLVENAIRHGVGASNQMTTIRIAACRDDDSLQIVVENDLARGTASAPPGFGIGLRNVDERLHMRFGERARLIAGSQDGGKFSIAIFLPWRTA